jgi:hypothetical protein
MAIRAATIGLELERRTLVMAFSSAFCLRQKRPALRFFSLKAWFLLAAHYCGPRPSRNIECIWKRCVAAMLHQEAAARALRQRPWSCRPARQILGSNLIYIDFALAAQKEDQSGP